jgi:hypothetical protein
LSLVFVCDCRGGLVWRMDLLTTYTYHWELQVITTLSLISTIYKTPAHAECCPHQPCPGNGLLTAEILQLSVLRSSCHSCPCRTQLNSTIAPYLLNLPYRAQLNCQTWTDWIAPIVFFITPRRRPHREHRSSIVACLFVSAGTCLPSRCSEMAVRLFACCVATAVMFVSRSMPSNGSVCLNITNLLFL